MGRLLLVGEVQETQVLSESSFIPVHWLQIAHLHRPVPRSIIHEYDHVLHEYDRAIHRYDRIIHENDRIVREDDRIFHE